MSPTLPSKLLSPHPCRSPHNPFGSMGRQQSINNSFTWVNLAKSFHSLRLGRMDLKSTERRQVVEITSRQRSMLVAHSFPHVQSNNAFAKRRVSFVPKSVLMLCLHLIILSSPARALTGLYTLPYQRARTTTCRATQDLPDVLKKEDDGKSTIRNPGAVGLYVHIPYCRQRCRYCDFAIVPVGSRFRADGDDGDDDDDDDAQFAKWRLGFTTLDKNYTCALVKELERLFRQERCHYQVQNGEPIKIALRSIYFGGGTPSLASIATIETILQTILAHPESPFVPDATSSLPMEMTIEMDPGTFNVTKLKALQRLGFNRISLGVQSFSDSVLKYLGRQHTSKDIWESVRMLNEVFNSTENDSINYSIDLISGLPGVSLALWAETLYTAINRLQPPPKHLSIYDLQIESGTVFGNWYENEQSDDEANDARSAPSTWHSTRGETPLASRPTLPSDEDAAFQYQFTAGYLRAKGFEHYEVSSYAQKTSLGPSPWRSQHNQVYWGYDTSWYAVGLGSTSFVRERSLSRPRALVDYIDWVEQEYQAGMEQNQRPSNLDLLMDVCLKRLRTAEGLDMNWVQTKFGLAYVDAILKGASLGLELGLAIQAETEVSHVLKLTDSSGLLYSNSIISSIFVELEALEDDD